MNEVAPNVSPVRKSVNKTVVASAQQATTKAIVKRASKRKNIKQHPTSSVEIDTTNFQVTPGSDKTLWLPENHQLALNIPAAIKVTPFSDVKPTSIDALPKTRLPASQYQSELDLVGKVCSLSCSTCRLSKKN